MLLTLHLEWKWEEPKPYIIIFLILNFLFLRLNILLPSLVALYKSIAPEKDDSSYSASASVVFNIENPYKP